MPGFIVRSADIVAAQERRTKLAHWRAAGVDPYPSNFADRTTIAVARARLDQANGSALRVRLAGRLTARRKHKTLAVLYVLDGSGSIEAHARRDSLDAEALERTCAFDVGDIIGIEGVLGLSRHGKPLLTVESATLLAKALRPLPDASNSHEQAKPSEGFDLLASRHARELVVLRGRVLAAIRAWLDDQGYVEVDAPILQRARNGDGARPFLTRHHALDRELSLRNSVQLQLRRCIVGGVERVYDLGKCFRNEGISYRHNPEFTMLEWSAAYADCGDAAATVEALVASVAERVLGTTVIERDGVRIDLRRPWHRCSVRDAIFERTGIDVLNSDELARCAVHAGTDASASPAQIIGELYAKQVEPTLLQPTIVLDWPAEMLPLVKRQSERPELADGFDAVIAGIELASGDSDLNDPDDQAARFVHVRNGREPDAGTQAHEGDVVATLEYGMPPVGGGGLGVDRLVMLLAGCSVLRDVLMFPEAA